MLWHQAQPSQPTQLKPDIIPPQAALVHVFLAPLQTSRASPPPAPRPAAPLPRLPEATEEPQVSLSSVVPALHVPAVHDDSNGKPVDAPSVSTQPATASPAPVRPPIVDPADSAAQYLHNPAPVYPPLSRRRGEQGRVIVSALVSSDGLVKEASVEVSSGFARLDEAALSAVRAWRFVPATRDDVAVHKRHLIPLIFVLSGA